MRLVSFVNILTTLLSISTWAAEKPPEKIQRLLDRVAEKSGDPFHRMALAHELGRSDRMELQRWVTDDQIAAVLRRVPGMTAISEEIAILSFHYSPAERAPTGSGKTRFESAALWSRNGSKSLASRSRPRLRRSLEKCSL